MHPRCLLTATRCLAVALTVAVPVFAQVPASSPQSATAKPLVFEVASVGPSKAARSYGVRFTPDGITATGVPLKYIVRSAYNQTRDQFWFGEPAWLDTAIFDIEAKFDYAEFKDPTDDQRRAMLQALLADRFKLAIHHETRDLPLYALVVAKTGPKLREAKPESYMRDDSNHVYCRAGLTNFRQCTMAEFADDAAIVGIDRIVVDKTGLIGRYDFELLYERQTTAAATSPGAPPDIFTAIQDQLGLKLQPIRGPVDVLVVDHIERPTEN